ncbi:MAG: response regulator [Oligoflexia bacterium]|nr:response regulator [Oligoflexia bacterium]
MPNMRYLDRNLRSAAILGFAALLTNVSCVYLLEGHPVMFAGNIFLFCSAGALGIPSTMVATALGSFPIALFISGDHFEALRILFLCLAISYCARQWHRIPMFVVTLALWATIFAPAILLGNHYSFLEGNSNLIFTVISETLFTMIAGALLLNTSVWGAITHRPRQVSLTSLLAHFLAIVACVVMLTVLSIQVNGGLTFDGEHFRASPKALATLIFICVALPLYLGWRLARRIGIDSQELFDLRNPARARSKTFANLPRDLWARTKTETSVSSSSSTLVGQTEGTLPRAAAPESPSGFSPDLGICALNRNGTITFVNRKFRQLSELSNNDVLGKRIEAVDMNPAVRTAVLELLDASFEGGPRVSEIKLNKLPDKLRYLELASRKPDSLENSSLNDGPDSIIVTLRDVTNRRTVESHLLQGQKLTSLSSLLNNLGHSFNNTLTAIIGQASFARRLAQSDSKDGALDNIIKASQEAGQLVNKLLEFTTQSPGHMKRESVSEVVAAKVSLLQKIIGENYELRLKQPDKDLFINCDSNLVMQVLTNLVTNSRESYQGKPGEIEISIAEEHIEQEAANFVVGARPGHFARVQVKDSGCGMSADVLAKAFNPLYSTKHSMGHSGLGLSIVYAIVRAHDGFLAVESHPDRGTTVSAYFPLLDVASSAITTKPDKQAAPAQEIARGSHEKILVVEDEQNVRDLVATMLRMLDYEVTTCSNGQEALEQSKQHKFDLFLVDMILPRIGGIELLHQLRGQAPGARTLLMTGYGSNVDPESSKTHVIPKPFDIETLARAIREALSATQVEPAHSHDSRQGSLELSSAGR